MITAGELSDFLKGVPRETPLTCQRKSKGRWTETKNWRLQAVLHTPHGEEVQSGPEDVVQDGQTQPEPVPAA
jgi:hypothetical protein